MQGKKVYQEQLFTTFRLSDRIPKENFYRRLTSELDLDYLYELTKVYYGSSGQKSIDPVMFFKLCLVGYLENIISDRKLIQHCNFRLDILYFLGYDIDEELPWHSTISRTRQLWDLEKVNTLGIKQANKIMHLAAIAYNLKKYLKFITKTAKSEAKALVAIFSEIKATQNLIGTILSHVNYSDIQLLKMQESPQKGFL